VKKQRPPGLIAIVLYKSFVASLLTVTSSALLLALNSHHLLEALSESLFLETKLNIVKYLLAKILIIKPHTLLFSGVATGLYAILTVLEAVGLWYEKAWATILVLLLVGISIPPEIYELVHGVTVLKLAVFIANLAVLWYLLHHWQKQGKGA
jgi:Predicted membrane protein